VAAEVEGLMPLALYLDENVDVSVAAGLRRRGIDVVTARDREKRLMAGKCGCLLKREASFVKREA
jgi:hypothetical protein